MQFVECLQSSSVHQSPAFNVRRHKVRTSLDLELDLQAYNMQHTQVTEDIATLKQVKKRLEEAKAQGTVYQSVTFLGEHGRWNSLLVANWKIN